MDHTHIYTPTSPRQGLATAAQAASYLSLSRTTLWRLERQGSLQPIRIGRALRFRWSDLQGLAGGEK
ncbi:MAG: helix-turn-helix domain-containing protein [Thiomonas sp.]|nr:helix-turn-helix domain-containing protein [Thiomonas sp.]